MKIGKRFFPILDKNKFNYDFDEADDFILDDKPDCYLTFNIKNKLVTIDTDWKDDFDVDELISLLVLIATGEIIKPIFDIFVGVCEAGQVEYLKNNLKAKLKEYQAAQHGGEDPDEVEEEDPLVQPIDMFDHLANMSGGPE